MTVSNLRNLANSSRENNASARKQIRARNEQIAELSAIIVGMNY